jgi:hypothetical protein
MCGAGNQPEGWKGVDMQTPLPLGDIGGRRSVPRPAGEGRGLDRGPRANLTWGSAQRGWLQARIIRARVGGVRKLQRGATQRGRGHVSSAIGIRPVHKKGWEKRSEKIKSQ